MNLLFVCSRNQWRSPTAEVIFKNSDEHNARSAGTADSARVRLNEAMLEWADIIFVMEQKHKRIIRERFPIQKEIIVLDIPDEYQYMDEELVEMIKASVAPYLV